MEAGDGVQVVMSRIRKLSATEEPWFNVNKAIDKAIDNWSALYQKC